MTAALLPWLAHAALGFAEPDADRRWRAAWRTGLLLALVTAFAPVAWWTAVVLTVIVLAAIVLLAGSAGSPLTRSTWAPPLAALAVVPVLLLPWWLPALLSGAWEGLLLDAGRLPSAPVDAAGLLLGRLESLGAPAWWAWPLPLLALIALLPRRTRAAVLLCWLVAAVTAVVAGALTLPVLDLGAVSTGVGLGFPLVLLPASLITAVVLGALGIDRARLAGWRRAVGGVAAAVAVAVPVAGLGWFVVGGGTSGDAGLQEADSGDIPAYMLQSAQQGPEHGILVVRGTVERGLTYDVRRDDGVRLGEDEIIALSREDAEFSQQVGALLSRPSPEAVGALAEGGVEYVVLPAPADPAVAAGLDATDGLVQASAERRTTRAWQVDRPLSDDGLESGTSSLRMPLLLAQAAAVIVVVVLAAPSSERSRS